MFSHTDTEVPEEHNLEETTKKLSTKRTIKQTDKWQIKEEQYYSILNEGKANTKSCAVRIRSRLKKKKVGKEKNRCKEIACYLFKS